MSLRDLTKYILKKAVDFWTQWFIVIIESNYISIWGQVIEHQAISSGFFSILTQVHCMMLCKFSFENIN